MAISCDPNDLAALAKCFKCLPGATLAEVQTYLLCQILNNGGTGGGGLPTGNAPAFTVVGNPTAVAAPRIDTTRPSVLGLGVGVVADPVSAVVIANDIKGDFTKNAISVTDTNTGGGFGVGTSLLVNQLVAPGTIIDLQSVGVSKFKVSSVGTATAVAYAEKVSATATTGNIDLNVNTAGIFTVAQSGSITFTFSTGTAGVNFKVIITGDASHTVTWPVVKWPGGVAPVQTLNKIDVYTFLYDGTNFYGSAVQNLS